MSQLLRARAPEGSTPSGQRRILPAILLPIILLFGAASILMMVNLQREIDSSSFLIDRVEMGVGSPRATFEIAELRLALREFEQDRSPDRIAHAQLRYEVLYARLSMLARGAHSKLMEADEIARSSLDDARTKLDAIEPEIASLGAGTNVTSIDAQLREMIDDVQNVASQALLYASMMGQRERDEAVMRARFQLGAVGLMVLGIVAGLITALAQNRKLEQARAGAQAMSEEFERLASLDPLTGLPNRKHGRELGVAALVAARARGAQMGVLSFDVDRFKQINDTLGHGAGDDLLREIAARLSAVVRAEPGVVATRIGGDEFWLGRIMPGDEAEMNAFARRVLSILKREYSLDGHHVAVGVSGGVACSDESSTLESILSQADMALRHAKERGRAQLADYRPGMVETRDRRLALERAMQDALERGEFSLRYQPIVSAQSGAPEAVEALLRWEHPAFGHVSPAEFIPIAEETGHIVAIGAWVLRRACADAATMGGLGVAVNVSPVQLLRANLGEQVRAALAGARLDPRRLELEITETMLLRNEARVHAFIEEMDAIGVQLALDDFGVGYSSLSYLRRFAVRGLKIDRSFAEDIENADGARALTRAMVDVARALSLRVTAEGVETAGQALALAAQGADRLQGYYFARPMTLEDARRWLTERRPRLIAVS